MAYTIISQNNSTTTLSDGVNTITVPSRVNLTSGNFTIVEVNNNMATLEDGDGNVYRDIPCVATLAGEGGGGGSGLPDQTGHSGEFLTTDGTDASWATVDALKNTATGTSSLSVGKATTANNVVTVVNSNAASVTTAQGSAVVGSGAVSQARDGVAFGRLASVYSINGEYGIAIGGNSSTRGRSGINIGYGAGSNGGNGDYGIAIGRAAQAKQNYSIQLGNGSNNEAGTFYVASYYNSANVNYKLMDADGTIPTARFTTDPSADGTYVPTLTIASGVATRSWSAPSGGLPSQTGNAGKFLTTDGTDASWSDKPLVNKSTTGDGIVIAGSGESNRKNIVIGYNTSGTMETLALGHSTRASGYSLAIGNGAEASGNVSVAIGLSARATAGCIQISCNAFTPKINSNANTFKVGNANGNFEMMDANGNLPADRLASTTGLADGNYRLRLTMASGVPTLSWVAE